MRKHGHPVLCSWISGHAFDPGQNDCGFATHNPAGAAIEIRKLVPNSALLAVLPIEGSVMAKSTERLRGLDLAPAKRV